MHLRFEACMPRLQTLHNASYEDAQEFLGKDLVNCDDPAQFAWCGHKTWIMHALTSNAELCTCVLTRRFDEDKLEWGRTTNKTELRDWVKDYDHPIGEAMVSLMTRDKEEDIPMMPLQHHSPPTTHYVRGRVAIVGDAANATTPWRGSAGSMSIEDALILSSCFAKVKDKADAEAALKAYETVQVPRRSRLAVESYRAGLIASGCDATVGLDAEKMKQTLENSWEWIHTVDLKDQVQKALSLMEAERKNLDT